jgi:hypothetical protein
MRAFHLLNQGSLEMSVDDMGEDAVCSSVVPFSLESVGPMRPVSEDMILVRVYTSRQTRNANTTNGKTEKTNQSLNSEVDGLAAEGLKV